MSQLHSVIANSVILYLLLVGLWGLGGYFRGFSLSRNYAGALVVGEIVLLVQAVVGVTLLVLGRVPGESMHFLYGVGASLGLPIAYTYVHGREDRSALLTYSLAALFTFGLTVRAMTTGF